MAAWDGMGWEATSLWGGGGGYEDNSSAATRLLRSATGSEEPLAAQWGESTRGFLSRPVRRSGWSAWSGEHGGGAGGAGDMRLQFRNF